MSKATWNGARFGSKKKARKAAYEERKKNKAETARLEILFRKF